MRVMAGCAFTFTGRLMDYCFVQCKRRRFMTQLTKLAFRLLQPQRTDLAVGFMTGKALALFGWRVSEATAIIRLLVALETVAFLIESRSALELR